MSTPSWYEKPALSLHSTFWCHFWSISLIVLPSWDRTLHSNPIFKSHSSNSICIKWNFRCDSWIFRYWWSSTSYKQVRWVGREISYREESQLPTIIVLNLIYPLFLSLLYMTSKSGIKLLAITYYNKLHI